MGGKRPLGKAWSVANARLQEGADVDIDLEANRAGGRETAGADLYISSISEPGRGGLIPESTEFGTPVVALPISPCCLPQGRQTVPAGVTAESSQTYDIVIFYR